MRPTKVTVTRYCPTCKRTTKTELTMRGPAIVKVRCLSSKARERKAIMTPRHTITLEVPHQTLLDLLVTAVEGGSNYWASFRSIERDSDFNILKCTVVDGYGEDSKTYVATPSTILKGIQALCDRTVRPGKHDWSLKPEGAQRHFTDALGDHDATTADVVLQMGLLGELVYG